MTKEAIDDGYRAVAYSVGEELEKALARIRELEAQLAEAEKMLREKEDGQLARYWMNRFDKAEAKFDTAIQQLTLANGVNRELAARAETAEAQVAELKGNWKKYEPIVGRMEKAEAEAAKLRGLLDDHRRFHSNVGCLGFVGACEVCVAENEYQAALSPAPQPSWTIADGWPAGEDAKRFV